jgi:hypothetical protein
MAALAANTPKTGPQRRPRRIPMTILSSEAADVDAVDVEKGIEGFGQAVVAF